MRKGILPLVLVSAVALAACNANRGTAVATRSGPIDVVAAENFWGSIAGQIGGDHVRVTSIISNPDSDPHDYEPTPADARLVAGARYVIENGAGYDPWAAKLVAGNPADGRAVLDIGAMLQLQAGANPHRWYFPADLDRVVTEITSGYQRLDPADAAYFAQRRDRFETVSLGDYHSLLAQIKNRYAGAPVGASESIFAGIAAAAQLSLLTPPGFLNAISEGTEPSAQDKQIADSQIAGHAITVFVFNSQNSTPDVQSLVEAAKAQHIPVVAVTETLSPKGATFQDWQTRQLRDLQQALAQATGR